MQEHTSKTNLDISGKMIANDAGKAGNTLKRIECSPKISRMIWACITVAAGYVLLFGLAALIAAMRG